MSVELHEVEVTIAADGGVSIRVAGMEGDSCLSATEALELLLGGEVLERVRTDGEELGQVTDTTTQQLGF